MMEGTAQSVQILTTPAGATWEATGEGMPLGEIVTPPGSFARSGTTFGNIVFGGGIDVMVDASIGTNYEYPQEITVEPAPLDYRVPPMVRAPRGRRQNDPAEETPMHILPSIRLLSLMFCGLYVYMTEVSFAQVKVCPLEEAIKRLEDYNINRGAQDAQQERPLLTALQEIITKAKNPSLPTGTQLEKPDLDRFQQIRYQLLTIQAQAVVNSGYLRDSRVIAQAAKVAYDMRMGRTFDERNPDFFYYWIVTLLSAQHPPDQLQVTTPREGECTLEAGLHFNEQLMMRQETEVNVKEAIEKLKIIAQHYGLDLKHQGWIQKIPSLQDQQTAKIQMGIMQQAAEMLTYINNMENLKALTRVSVLGYQSDMEDIRVAHNEEELGRVGTGWTERLKKYDERTQILSGLLNMIAQKVPSDTAIEAQGREKRLQDEGVIK
jgi:hypothetical protein